MILALMLSLLMQVKCGAEVEMGSGVRKEGG